MNAPDRSVYLGGSDAAAVLGVSPWKTPLALYLEKVEGRREDDPAKARIFARGKRLEPIVIDMLADEEGLQIAGRNQRYIDPEHPFLAAEIDFEWLHAGTLQNGEIKTVHNFATREWGDEEDEIPIHYAAQATHGLMVTGRQVCKVGVLFGADNLVVYSIHRDEETIAAMRAKELAFWNDHVLARKPPEPVNNDDLLRLFRKDACLAVEATSECLSALERVRELKGALKSFEEELEAQEFIVKSHMREAARLTEGGKDLATWKTQTRRALDQRALSDAHPELFERFKAVSEIRVFRLK